MASVTAPSAVHLVRDALRSLRVVLADRRAASAINVDEVVDGLREVLEQEGFLGPPPGDGSSLDEDHELPAEQHALSMNERQRTIDSIADLLFVAHLRRRASTENDTEPATSLLGYCDTCINPEAIVGRSLPDKALKGAFAIAARFVLHTGSTLSAEARVLIRRISLRTFLLLHRAAGHQTVQAEALLLYLALIQHTAADENEADALGTLKMLLRTCGTSSAPSSTGQGVRAAVYRVVGAIALRYASAVAADSAPILELFLHGLHVQAAKADAEVTVSEGLLLGFADFLTTFGTSVDEGASFIVTLYRFLQAVLATAENSTRYAMCHAALMLLQRHAVLFKELLLVDAMNIVETLIALCGHKNAPLHKRAFPAASAALQAIALELCTDRQMRREDCVAVLGRLLSRLKPLITNGARFEVSFAITAYGLLARPLAVFVGSADVITLFSEIVLRCEAIFSRGQEEVEEATTHLAQYVHTYACMLLEIAEPTASHATAVDTLLHTVLVMYPMQFYFQRLKHATAQAVLKLLVACSRATEALTVVFSTFVRRGLALTLGTSAVFTARASAPDTSAAAPPIDADEEGALWEEYVPLWKALFTVPSDAAENVLRSWGFPWSHTSGLLSHDVSAVVGLLRNAFLRTVVDMVRQLDLTVKKMDPTATHGASQPSTMMMPTQEAHMGTLTVSRGLVAPANPKDYSLFLNLVSFWTAVAPSVLIPAEIANWGVAVLEPLICTSAQHPHVSGLYTMIQAVIRQLFRCDEAPPCSSSDDEQSRETCRALLRVFIRGLMERLGDFSRELLVAALLCILDCPDEIILPEECEPCLVQALDIGLVHEPCACSALDRLLSWLNRRSDFIVKPHLITSLQKFAKHASSSSSSGRTHGDRATAGDAIVQRLVAVLSHQGSLTAVAEEGIRRQQPDAAPSQIAAARRIKIRLPFRDASIDLILDSLVPHVAKIATTATERAARTAAAELLHSIVVWLIGAAATLRAAQPGGVGVNSSSVASAVGQQSVALTASDVSSSLRELLPCALELASSPDPVLQQLFGPLLMQMARWFAQSTSEAATELLDVLMQGTSRKDSAAMRSACAEAVAEFQRWSIHARGATMLLNCRNIYRRLFSLLTHPSVWQRLGAAAVIGALHEDFIEVEELVAEHTLDLVYYSFIALLASDSVRGDGISGSRSGVDDAVSQLKIILQQLERTVIRHSRLFNDDEPQPPGLRSASRFETLAQLVAWLFEQCGCVESNARHTAMRLFVSLCSCLKGFDSDDGPMRWLAANRQNRGADFYAGMFSAFRLSEPHRVLGGDPMSLEKYIEWTTEIEASLEAHDWLLVARFLPAAFAFGRRGLTRHGGGASLKIPERPTARVDSDDDGAVDPLFLTPPAVGLPLHAPQAQRHRGEDELAAHNAEWALPRSQLMGHLYYFTAHMVHNSAAPVLASTDSQAAWIHAPRGRPLRAADHLTIERRRLAVLEAAAPLLDLLTARYPSSVWLESDPEVQAEGVGSVAPVMHQYLYQCAARCVLCPSTLFPDATTNIELGRRVQLVGELLLRITWRACTERTAFVGEIPSLLQALRKALVFDVTDLGSTAQFFAADILRAGMAVRGLRAVHRAGCLAAVLMGSLNPPPNDVAKLATSAFHSAVELALERGLPSAGVKPLHPLYLAAIRELVLLSMDLGLPVSELVDAVLDDTPLFSLRRASTSDLSRLSAASFGDMSITTASTCGGRLFRILTPEIESFVASHPRDTVQALIPHRNHGVAWEILKTLGRASAALPSHVVEEVLDAWRDFCGAGGDVSNDPLLDQLLNFRSTVFRLLLDGGHVDIVLERCGDLLAEDTNVCLTGSDGRRTAYEPHGLLDNKKAVRLFVAAAENVARILSACRTSSRAAFLSVTESAVAHVVCNELPLLATELKEGSVAYESYIDVVTALLCILESTASRGLLFALIPLLRHQLPDLLVRMKRAVLRCVELMDPAEQVQTCCQAVQTQQGALPPDVRRVVARGICLTALKLMPTDDAERFYCSQILGLIEAVQDTSGALLTAGPIEANNERLLRRTYAFVVIEAMYRLCRPEALKGVINAAFLGSSSTATGKELTEKLIRICVAAKATLAAEPSQASAQVLLEYRQAAYCCLAAAVIATQRQEKIFVQFLLREKGSDLWHAIIDLRQRHVFTVESRHRHQVDALRDIRSAWDDAGDDNADDSASGDEPRGPRRNAVARMKYLSSQYLIDSHFNPDSPPTDPTAEGSAVPHRSQETPAGRLPYRTQEMQSITRYKQSLLQGTQKQIAEPGGQQEAADPFEFSLSSGGTRPRGPGESSALVPRSVEVDSVWANSYSSTVLRLLDHMATNFVPAHAADGGVIPFSWLREISAIFASPGTHLNVKIFLCRLICLCPKLFECVAQEVFVAMVDLAVNSDLGKGLHYFARDICITFLQWRGPLPQPAVPQSDAAAHRLLSYLARNVSHHSNYIVRENLELVKCFIERWSPRYVIPKVDILGWLTYDLSHPMSRPARMCGVQLCGVLVANNIPLYNPHTDSATIGEVAFYKILSANLTKATHDVAMATAEVLGRALKVVSGVTSLARTDPSEVLRDCVTDAFLSIFNETPARFFSLLRQAAVHCPEVVDPFVPARILSPWVHSNTSERVAVLDLIAMRPTLASAIYPSITAHLSVAALHEEVKVALCRMLNAFVPHLAEADIEHMVNHWLPQLRHRVEDAVVDFRVAFYGLCIALYSARGGTSASRDDAVDTLLSSSMASGFCDPSLFVRDMVMRFWDDESRLPLGTIERFYGVMAKLPPANIGEPWVQFLPILLLFAVHRSPEFTRTDAIFPYPLAHCEFSPLNIDTICSVRSQRLLPMFAGASQTPVGRLATGLPASLGGIALKRQTAASRDGVLSQDQDAVVTGSFTTFNPVLQQRAEHRGFIGSQLLFQVGGTQVAADSHHSSDRASPAQPQASAAAPRLRRRFLEVGEQHAVRRTIMHTTRLRRQAAVLDSAAAKLREDSVRLFRRYRSGDVPDIQIPLQSFVVPLQALCLYDISIARRTAGLLCDGVMGCLSSLISNTPSIPATGGYMGSMPTAVSLFADVPNAPGVDYRTLRDEIRGRLGQMLSEQRCVKSREMVSFTHEILLADPGALDSLQPEAVYRSCLGTSTFSSGVVVLERLIERVAQQIAEVRSRTQRSISMPMDADLEALIAREDLCWLYLYNLYERRGDVHLAQAAACRILPVPEELADITAQIRRGDIESALGRIKTYTAKVGAALDRCASDSNTPFIASEGKQRVVRAVVNMRREALATLLQWDDIIRTFPAEVVASPASLLSDSADGVHELSLLVSAKARGSSLDVRRTALVGVPDADEAPRTFERFISLFENGLYEETVSLFWPAARSVLAVWGTQDETDGAAAYSISPAIGCVSNIVCMRDAAALFTSRRFSASRVAAELRTIFRGWNRSQATPFDAPPLAWFDALLARRMVGEHAMTFLHDKLAAESSSPSPLSSEEALQNEMGPLQRDCNMGLRSIALTAGARLSLRAPTNLAAKRFLEVAMALSPPGSPFEMAAWATVLRTTILRVTEVQLLAGETLRKTFGDIQSLMKAKAAKEGLETGGADLRLEYAGLQAFFWSRLSRRLWETEGAACVAEVAPMISKCVKKFAASFNVLPADVAQIPIDAALGPLMEFGAYCADMLDELLRASATSSAGDLVATLATVTVHLLCRLMDTSDPTARRRFPQILQALRASPSAQEEFARRTPLLSTWAVLPWAGQLVSALLGPVASAVSPLVIRLTLHHPQIMFNPYQCALQEIDQVYSEHSRTAAAPHSAQILAGIAALRAMVSDKAMSKLRSFCASLHKLHYPEFRFRGWVDDIKTQLSALRDAKTLTSNPELVEAARRHAQQLWERCYEDCFDASVPGIGTYNRRFCQDWQTTVKRELCDPLVVGPRSGQLNLDYVKFRTAAAKLTEEMRTKMQVKDRVPLGHFSETLGAMQLSSHGSAFVECPMQPFKFLDAAVPFPIPRIVAVDQTIAVMGSMQRPKRIVLYTSDEGRVTFLVKGGDDLRLDQRLQELFASINFALVDARIASASALYARVYSVIPLSKKAGLIEWVDNTEPLKHVIERSMHRDTTLAGREPSVDAHPATKKFLTFVQDVDSHRQLTLTQRFLVMFRAISNHNGSFSSRVHEWITSINPYYLRDGIADRCPSRVDWFHLRNRFASTTAVLSAAGYILGVGDRHLQNFLIDRASGDNIAIDFGHAFGSATVTLPIPELVPMRLTPQMVAAFGPLGTKVVSAPMEATLAAIQRHRGILTPLMSVFLLEPISGWDAPKASGGGDTNADELWAGAVPLPSARRDPVSSAARKIAVVHRKLAMENPVYLMSEDVQLNPHVAHAQVYEEVARVVYGDPVRRDDSRKLNTVHDQVAVLVSLATDENVLGRTWVGWSPFF